MAAALPAIPLPAPLSNSNEHFPAPLWCLCDSGTVCLLTYLLTYYRELGHYVPVSKQLHRKEKLGRYDDADVVLTLPSPLTASDLRWLSVWCEEFAVRAFYSSQYCSIIPPQNFVGLYELPASLYVCILCRHYCRGFFCI